MKTETKMFVMAPEYVKVSTDRQMNLTSELMQLHKMCFNLCHARVSSVMLLTSEEQEPAATITSKRQRKSKKQKFNFCDVLRVSLLLLEPSSMLTYVDQP